MFAKFEPLRLIQLIAWSKSLDRLSASGVNLFIHGTTKGPQSPRWMHTPPPCMFREARQRVGASALSTGADATRTPSGIPLYRVHMNGFYTPCWNVLACVYDHCPLGRKPCELSHRLIHPKLHKATLKSDVPGQQHVA